MPASPARHLERARVSPRHRHKLEHRQPGLGGSGDRTVKAIRKAMICGALVLGAAWSSATLASTSATRTSSFAYDSTSGLLTQEVVEPNTPSLRLETDTVYDAFGNKTSVTVSGVDIT